MHRIPGQLRNVAFGLLLATFALLVIVVGLAGPPAHIPGTALATLAIAFVVLGLAVVVLTVKLHEARTTKLFFVLAGAAAAAMPICAVMHNVVYGLFAWWFGDGFWGSAGDEPVFFLLAIVVCPALFVFGAVGSMVILARDSMQGNGKLQ
jgi:Ni/Fe-hydrogenase subunit HybB-like protein